MHNTGTPTGEQIASVISGYNNPKDHIKYLDYLNVAACFSVVALHVNTCIWRFPQSIDYWKSCVAIECIFYWAVPIFFMITGCTLMDFDRKYSLKIYFKKRVLRTFIPFIIWSFIAIAYNLVIHKIDLSALSVKFLLDQIINTRLMRVYWFFIPLFAVYLSIPVLNAIDRDKRKRVFLYAAFIAFLTVSFLPGIFKILNIRYNGALQVPVAGGFLIYVLLGYLLENNFQLTKKQRYLIYALGLLGLFSRMYTLYYWSLANGKIDNTLKGYTIFPTVFFSVAVFVFFKYELTKCNFVDKYYQTVRYLSSCSFGIYLVHVYFSRHIPGIFHFSDMSLWWRTLGVFVVYGCALLVVSLFKKTPTKVKIVTAVIIAFICIVSLMGATPLSVHNKPQVTSKKFSITPETLSYARIDVKNEGMDNDVDVLDLSDASAKVDAPQWMRKNGNGRALQGRKDKLSFKLKCKGDGKLNITLRGPDIRDGNDERIPVWVQYSKLVVDSRVIFDTIKPVWHDKPHRFNMDVKDGQIVDVLVEWVPDCVTIGKGMSQLAELNEKPVKAAKVHAEKQSEKIKSLESKLKKTNSEKIKASAKLKKMSSSNRELRKQLDVIRSNWWYKVLHRLKLVG